MIFTENQLKDFAKPLSNTEEERCKNAIRMLSEALEDIGYDINKPIQLAYSDTLAYTSTLRMNGHNIKLLVQGSYANNTNVKTESDVDVAIIQEDVFITDYRTGLTKSDYGFRDSTYGFDEYKKDIYHKLVNKFKEENVEWKSKCILVKGNSYRVDADSVPCRRYKDYRNDISVDPSNYVPGIVIYSDENEKIINYPEQHIENGKLKNTQTNYFYKKMVRIFKTMRYMMIEEGISSANNINSFMIESLLWNIPNYKFTNNDESYIEKVQGLINYLMFIGKDELGEYTEVNNIKKLCDKSNSKENLSAFITDLKNFFKYEI